MAYHNFKDNPYGTTIAEYVSKAGNDSNSGSDPDAPRRTIRHRAGFTLVGAGYYNSFSIVNGSGNAVQLIGDGKVVLDNVTNTTGTIQMRNLAVINSSLIATNRERVFVDAFLKNCIVQSDIHVNVTRCIVINSTMTFGSAAGTWGHTGSIFKNCTLVHTSTSSSMVFKDNYCDENTVLRYLGGAGNFRNNNFRGIIQLEIGVGVYADFAIQDQLTGTPQDNGYDAGVEWLTESNLTAAGYTGTVSGWNSAVATCINRPPRFNDEPGEDFTLRSDSPHIGRAEDQISNIGTTRVAVSVLNSDDGIGGTRVIPSAEMDTSIPTAWVLNDGEEEGYVDYVVKTNGLVIEQLRLKDIFVFDSDFPGGSIQNNNVPDSQPLTLQYPSITSTTEASSNLDEIVVGEGLIAVGAHVRVNGQHREVISKQSAGGNDTITLDSELLALVNSGVDVSFGTEQQLASINPNRLTIEMRTRSSLSAPSVPLEDADWDNEIDPAYDKVGTLFPQELDKKPGLLISGSDVWGAGDSDAPNGLTLQECAPQWVHIRVYKRNNYSSKGL